MVESEDRPINAEPNKPMAEENWQVNPQLLEDSLLSCLGLLTKIYNRPHTEQALTAGLPLVDFKLTPDLFVRAAQRAGLTAQMVKRPLANIDQLMLPVVLLLKNKQACVLLKFLAGQRAEVMYPEMGAGTVEMDLFALSELCTNNIIQVKPAFKFSDRSEETIHTKPRHWFWSVFLKSWPSYSEVLLATFIINCFGLALPLFIMNVYDRVVPNHAVETLWVLALGICIVFLFEFVLRSLRGYLIDIAGKKVDLTLSAQIFEQVLGLKMSSRPGSVGAFANTVQGFEFFREFVTSSTITVLIDLPFGMLYIGIIALLGGTLALIPLCMVPLIIFVGYVLQLPMQKITEDSYKYSAEKQATLIETLGAMETIKSSGAESLIQRRWEQVVGLGARASIKLRLVGNSSVNFSVLAQEVTSVLVVILGVYKITQGEMTMGALIACTTLAGRALAPMSQVAALLTRYHQSLHSLEAIDNVMQMPTERPIGKTPLHRPSLNGAIQFREVSFRYPNQKLVALNRFSLSIQAGEKVGVLGRIGSGKTTMTKLILNLYQPTYGMVLIDGTELQQIDPANLRHNIGYVPQDIVLFYGNVKDNITLGAPHVTEEEVLQAAKVSGVDRFVNLHPDGYDWQVGERGAFLSGGQRQSIAVARAVLLNPKILIMDEPTNNMDSMTEEHLKQGLVSYVRDKTLILMTHKPSLLSIVDRLIILDGGRLIADGPRDEVLKALTSGGVKVPA